MFALARKFFEAVVPGVIRPLRVLWNEVIGFVFLCLALISAPAVYRSWKNFSVDGASENLGRLILTAIFGLVMLAYGIQSFLRARRIGKS